MLPLTLRAPAKLNLYLHILGKRDDGYHTIESLAAFTELADVLTLEASDTFSFSVEGEFAAAAGAGENNLVVKAALLLQARDNIQQGVRMVLTKNIPVGAGLGGGSADAAAALRGLTRLWNLNISKQELHSLAAKLGADVAMCLDSAPVIARGIGEQLTPLLQPLPALGILFAHPRTPLLTKDVYSAYTPSTPAPAWQGEFANAQSWVPSLKATRNDLQRAAISVDGAVAEVLLALETLQPTPELVRMTGSGACCFALYPTPAEAKKAAVLLQRHYPQWWVQVTRFLS